MTVLSRNKIGYEGGENKIQSYTVKNNAQIWRGMLVSILITSGKAIAQPAEATKGSQIFVGIAEEAVKGDGTDGRKVQVNRKDSFWVTIKTGVTLNVGDSAYCADNGTVDATEASLKVGVVTQIDGTEALIDIDKA